MELDEIENKIACNGLNAAQVFTQMKQHIYRQAPCKYACESKAFEIEIRNLKSDLEKAKSVYIELTNSAMSFDSSIIYCANSELMKKFDDIFNT